ncbi:MAG: MaoC/PaaZ C-terminal domain-containing protein [Brachybacterium sp.]|nr:MaoC/PaaZ C-terminal domain-containing protein [Brachybacterium sp.]
MRDLPDVPSFPAIYTAALAPRPGVKRRSDLPETVYRVRKVRIDPERAAAFDHLMGGPATDLAHPGVLHVLSFPVVLALMARPTFPVSLLGLVHLENQVLQHRPIRVGEKVDVEARVQNLRPHRKGRTFEAVATILNQDGEIIATDVSTYLARGGADSSGGGTYERREFTAPVPTGRWKLPASTGRRYAAVSGDANPIHMSALSARAFGFPRAIAHGMYTAARAFTESRVDLSRPLRWDVTFDAPVTLPGTVLVTYEDDGSGTVRCIGWKPGTAEKAPRRCFEVRVTTLG